MALRDGQQIKAKNKAVFCYDFTKDYVRIGKWNTDMSKSVNAETTDENNVWGESSFSIDAIKPSMDINPYKVFEGDALAEYIEAGVRGFETGDYWECSIIEVTVDDEGTVVDAYKYPCVLEPSAHGWDSGNYWHEFTVHYTGAGESVDGTIAKSADGRKQTFTIS